MDMRNDRDYTFYFMFFYHHRAYCGKWIYVHQVETNLGDYGILRMHSDTTSKKECPCSY